MTFRALALLAFAPMLTIPSIAGAQLDEAREHLANADFARAVRAFDRAEEHASLDRAALVSLYEGRAIAHWALGHSDLARADLRALASIDPEHVLAAEAPPELRRAFVDAPHEPIRIEARWDRTERSATLSGEVLADPVGLVRALRTHVRIEGSSWVVDESGSASVDAGPGDRLQGRVEALGPGGAIVASTDESAASEPSEANEAILSPSTPAGSDDLLWAGLAIGGGVAFVASIVIIAIAATLPNDATQPTAPILVGF